MKRRGGKHLRKVPPRTFTVSAMVRAAGETEWRRVEKTYSRRSAVPGGWSAWWALTVVLQLGSCMVSHAAVTEVARMDAVGSQP